MSNVNGASLFGSAVVGVLAGAAVGSIITALCDDDTKAQQKRNRNIEDITVTVGAALGIAIYFANNES